MYNAPIAKFREIDKRRDKGKKFPHLVVLLYDVANNESRLVIANPWLKGMPYKIRTQVVREFELRA